MSDNRTPDEKKTAAHRFAMCLLAMVDDHFFTRNDTPGEGYQDLSALLKNKQAGGLASAIRKTVLPQARETADFILDKKLAGEGWQVKQIAAEHDTSGLYKALILNKDGNTEIFFSGTPPTGVGLWMQDVDFAMAPFTAGDGKTVVDVHRGFAEVHEQIRGKVEAELAALAKDGRDITPDGTPGTIQVSGYSLGGPVSQLFALGLDDEQRRRVNVSTFAAPRLSKNGSGYEAAVHKLLPRDMVHFRVDQDPVPRVPTKIMGFEDAPGEHISMDANSLLSGRMLAKAAKGVLGIKLDFLSSAGRQGLISMPQYHLPMFYLKNLMGGTWRQLDISSEKPTSGPQQKPGL